MMGALQALLASLEPKVKAGSAAALVAGVLVWVLGRYLFRGSVPAPVVALIDAAVPAAFALAAGYLAPHQTRAGEPAAPAAPAPRHAVKP
jgi:hypothetical protein